MCNTLLVQKFNLFSDFKPAGDQPSAIKKLIEGIKNNKKDQVLLGVTGSGKTFTMANVIYNTQRPALVMAPNKTLAAQLYEEMLEFFPENAVEYFVSYYDYYLPESYNPKSDTYIEKDSSINERIDRLRHSTTRSLLERKDVVIISSVSCIYGIGSPELYSQMNHLVKINDEIKLDTLQKKLVSLQYKRNDTILKRGGFSVCGDIVNIHPAHYENKAWKLSFFGDTVESISEFNPITGKKKQNLKEILIFASSHYAIPQKILDEAVIFIKQDLQKRANEFSKAGKFIECQRIQNRTNFDIEMILETGNCKGIENYSRYFSKREEGSAPPTLFEYLTKNFLLFIDESHVSVPQIGAMYSGDRARKTNLIEHGFRLPSALDNRPLKFSEWEDLRPQTIYISATPGKFELERTKNEFIEQIIRPTGLVDPYYTIKPVETQIDDLIQETRKVIKKKYRILVTTVTKKMAENLSEYLRELNFKVTYLHSEVKTLERIETIHMLRSGEIDILVGVNLLREGLDIPECGLVAILNADEAGFLRSESALIQTIGRAARNIDGRVILYADKKTDAIKKALKETDRRRKKQQEHNIKHNITPTSIVKKISQAFTKLEDKKIEKEFHNKTLEELEIKMLEAAENLDFELAAKLRDKIKSLK